MGGVRKGQTFIIGAVILASLVIMVYSSYSGFFTQPSTDETQRFFERTLHEPGDTFDRALKENYSVKYVEEELYSWNSFVDRRAREKGMEYGAVNLFVIPERGKTVLINYQDSAQEVNLTVNGDTLRTEVEPLQKKEKSFSSSSASINLEMRDKGINRSFDAYNPRILTFTEISTTDERWRNHVLK